MHPRLRPYAHAHWAALDAALTRSLPAHTVADVRSSFQHAAEHMSDTYAHLLDVDGDATASDERRAAVTDIVRELKAALSAAWHPPRL
jgi:hypothetical protein